jgi:hypothetical protein
MHPDKVRSANLNVKLGLWYCFAGCGGGKVDQLLANESLWSNPSAAAAREPREVDAPLSESLNDRYVEALDDRRANALCEARGLRRSTLEEFEIGWDAKTTSYTIPVRGLDEELLNIRYYRLGVGPDQSKIRSVTGRGEPRLFPYRLLEEFDPESQVVVICEGEWDAIITNERTGDDVIAITRTGSAKVWRPDWSEFFEDAIVYLAHDCDHMGGLGNQVAYASLSRFAREIYWLRLPYPFTDKNGKDLTDAWKDGIDVLGLMEHAPCWKEGNDAMKIQTVGVYEDRGEKRGPSGETFRDSAVVARPIVRVDELLEYLRNGHSQMTGAEIADAIERLKND